MDKYEGPQINGKRHGKGVYQWATGNRYEGEFKDGNMDGKGMFFYENGDKYEGDIVCNLQQGYGIYIGKEFMYEGEWFEGLMHGRGKYRSLVDGSVYEGEVVKGVRHGHGTWTYEDPDGVKHHYRGEYKNHRKDGYGKYMVSKTNESDSNESKKTDSNEYEGGFLMDLMHGKGVYVNGNGDIYNGHFKYGKRHGHGIMVLADGSIFDGLFENDAMVPNKGMLSPSIKSKHSSQSI